MIDQVHDRFLEHSINMVANATDGQWSKLTVQSSNHEPLTKLQYQKDVWQKYSRNNKHTLLQKLISYSAVSNNILQDVSILDIGVGAEFVSGNIHLCIEGNGEGHKFLSVASVGDEEHLIPMIGHITTTKVASAWKKRSKPKKTVIEECIDIIDVLSLIPPEYLQDEIEEKCNEQDGLLDHDEVDMEIDETHANVSLDNDSITPANVTQANIPSLSGTQ